MTSPPADEGWLRLDPRMLAVGPVRVLRQLAVPALIALVGIGTADGRFSALLLPVLLVGAVIAGAVPWLTTYHRVSDGQLQVRKGLVHRTVVTAPLDRVRSVDLESSLLQRMLGLTTVKIGTGVDDSRIELDGLAKRQAEHLRVFLLRRTETAYDDPAAPSEVDAAAPAAPPAPVELARIDWSWLRFAPFSLARLVIVVGLLGGLAQFSDELFSDELPLARTAEDAWEFFTGQALPLVLATAAVLALVGWLLISVGEYVVRWWALRLVRDQQNLRLTAGLFTTRSTTVEEARVRGVRLTEPALMRLVGGAELATLATGVGAGGTTTVLPPSPLAVDRRVAGAILGDDRPLVVRLVPHGPAARRRCHVQAQLTTLLAVLAAGFATLSPGIDGWLVPVVAAVFLVGGAAAGEATYRNLGHALTDDHLVSGAGVWQRTRTVLEREGVIGWVVRQSWFQRRAGLASLVATTAAGPERVLVEDVPLPTAIRLADETTPGLLAEFLVS